MTENDCVMLGVRPLTIEDVVSVARDGARVELPHEDESLRDKLKSSADCIHKATAERRTVYGVNTSFGGLSGIQIAAEDLWDLQENLIWSHKAGAGQQLPKEDVRGAMLLRANTFLQGASGVRWELLARIEQFLNHDVTPLVREFGSIGASGDLVPLATIAGAVVGLGDQYQVFLGEQADSGNQPRAVTGVLSQLGLEPIRLQPKEGLALINGTSMSTAMAATCLVDARRLFAVSMGAHALMVQAMSVMEESYDEFIHALKPHPGQLWTARQMRKLLKGSKLTSQTHSGAIPQADE